MYDIVVQKYYKSIIATYLNLKREISVLEESSNIILQYNRNKIYIKYLIHLITLDTPDGELSLAKLPKDRTIEG